MKKLYLTAFAIILAFLAFGFLTGCSTNKPELCAGARATLEAYRELAADPTWKASKEEIATAKVAAAVVAAYCYDQPQAQTQQGRAAGFGMHSEPIPMPRKFDRNGVLIVP